MPRQVSASRRKASTDLQSADPAPGGKIVRGRIALIMAAERLIAEQGYRRVTLREINASANMRNSSAIQYHFGSMDQLLKAVMEFRMEKTNQRRLALLEAVSPDDLGGIVRTMTIPLAEELLPRPGGNFYLRFLGQLFHETEQSIFGRMKPDYLEGSNRTEDMIRAFISDLPAELVNLRIIMSRVMVIAGLATIEARLARGEIGTDMIAIAASSLNDAVVAMLLASATPRGTSSLKYTNRPPKRAAGKTAGKTPAVP